jgi:hypothetical protein
MLCTADDVYCFLFTGRAPKRYSIQREANPKMRMEDMERSTDRWEGDAHTIMCAHYWTPLAEAIGEAIGEFDGGSGSESEAMCALMQHRTGLWLRVLRHKTLLHHGIRRSVDSVGHLRALLPQGCGSRDGAGVLHRE